MLSVGGISKKYTSAGNHSGYETTLYHSGLDEYRHVSAREKYQLHDKVHNIERILSNKWVKELEKRAREEERALKLDKKEQAERKTANAVAEQERLGSILEATLDIDDTVDWETLYTKESFQTNEFKNKPNLKLAANGKPTGFTALELVKEPKKNDFFKPVSFFKIILGQKTKVLAQQTIEYEAAIKKTTLSNEQIGKENTEIKKIYEKHLTSWKNLRKKFQEDQNNQNKLIDNLKEDYFKGETYAIEEYCDIVLGNSEYSDFFTKDYEFQYEKKSKSMIIDFQLPDISDIPTLLRVGYVASRDEVTEKHLSPTALNRLFESIIFQITLRTIHEIFEADAADAIDIVTLNGIIDSISPATGNQETKCILSLQTTKDEFETINLANVDPKQCFKSLKGVAASKLSSVTPVKPILNISREDRRFTDHYDVADALDETTNLAAMDWEDFEHLIRELFAKEFSGDGGEVKVTKASRDGGVDAVAFDPDPIRGGKIVIQAKRYTNIVSVSAVRDLYGTVTSEGANKGILVTTADYGPDAYTFAKDKPLTLLNGANLLHLLSTHGHSAKIDIAEAKRLQKEL